MSRFLNCRDTWAGICSRQGLRTAEIAEQVADFLVGELVEQSFRHQRFFLRQHFVNIIPFDGDTLPVGTADHDYVIILVRQKAVHGPAVFGDDQVSFEAFPDFIRGINDVDQHPSHIVPLEGGQVRADFAAVTEQLVALAAVFLEEFFARVAVRLALAGLQHFLMGGDLLLHFFGGRSGNGTEVFCNHY